MVTSTTFVPVLQQWADVERQVIIVAGIIQLDVFFSSSDKLPVEW